MTLTQLPSGLEDVGYVHAGVVLGAMHFVIIVAFSPHSMSRISILHDGDISRAKSSTFQCLTERHHHLTVLHDSLCAHDTL